MVGDGDEEIFALSVNNVGSRFGRSILESALRVVDAVGRATLGPVEVLSRVVNTNGELVSRVGTTGSNKIVDGGTAANIQTLVD